MTDIYIVEVFGRENGLYAFKHEDDADAFAAAVEGEEGDRVAYEARTFKHRLPVNVSPSELAELVEAEEQ